MAFPQQKVLLLHPDPFCQTTTSAHTHRNVTCLLSTVPNLQLFIATPEENQEVAARLYLPHSVQVLTVDVRNERDSSAVKKWTTKWIKYSKQLRERHQLDFHGIVCHYPESIGLGVELANKQRSFKPVVCVLIHDVVDADLNKINDKITKAIREQNLPDVNVKVFTTHYDTLDVIRRRVDIGFEVHHVLVPHINIFGQDSHVDELKIRPASHDSTPVLFSIWPENFNHRAENESRNFDGLLSGIKKVIRSRNESGQSINCIHWRIAGVSDQEQRNNLKSYIESKTGLASFLQIHFIESSADRPIQSELKLCWLYISPTCVQMDIVVLQAIVQGTPVGAHPASKVGQLLTKINPALCDHMRKLIFVGNEELPGCSSFDKHFEKTLLRPVQAHDDMKEFRNNFYTIIKRGDSSVHQGLKRLRQILGYTEPVVPIQGLPRSESDQLVCDSCIGVPELPPSPSGDWRQFMNRPSREKLQEISKLCAEERCYDLSLNPRGICILINMTKQRNGSQLDEQKMRHLFHQQLNFDIVEFIDKTHEDILRSLFRLVREERMRTCGCVVLILMAHGTQNTEGTFIYKDADERERPLKKVFETFYADRTKSPFLVGKPKLFILEVCRGGNEITPIDSELDNTTSAANAEASSFRFDEMLGSLESNCAVGGTEDDCIPDKTADMCWLYATLKGNKSYRHTVEGTWLIQSVYDVFTKYGHEMPVSSMADLVKNEITRKVHEKGFSQQGQFVSHLNKLLYLLPPTPGRPL